MSTILNCLASPFSTDISSVYDSSIVGSCSIGHILFANLNTNDVFPTVDFPKRTIVLYASDYIFN